jgi:hypothetical protein
MSSFISQEESERFSLSLKDKLRNLCDETVWIWEKCSVTEHDVLEEIIHVAQTLKEDL